MTTNCQFPNGARGMIGVSLVQSLRNRNCSVTGVQNVHPEASTDVSEMDLVSLRSTADNLTLLREVVNEVIDRGVQNLAVEQETENKSVVLGDGEKNIASKSKQPAFTLPKRTDAEKKEIMEALFAEHQKKEEHENLAEKEEAERLELEKKWNAENGVEDVREAAEKQIQLKKPKEEPVSSPAVEEEETSSDEELPEEEIAKMVAAMKKSKKAKKVAEKSAAEKETQRLLEEEAWKLSVGYAEIEKEFLAAKEKMDTLKEANPHKKKITLSIGGKNRVCAEEDPEKRKALDKRKALNNGDEVSKKNLFCPNGDGVNGEKEYKAGGIKINGCSYCCRSQTTMDKHIKMCKKIKYQYK